MGKAEFPRQQIGSGKEGDGALDDLEVLLQSALDSAAGEPIVMDPTGSANAMVFLLVTVLGLVMALIYVPLRLYLTLTARSRRLRLLQRIRRLRDELAQPVAG